MAYFGTNAVKTSTANLELIQTNKPVGSKFIQAYKFDFMNLDDCTIKINDGSAIYFPANKGFIVDETDEPVYKFEIVEANIRYYCIGTYKQN